MLSSIFAAFVKAGPISVMMRGVMEYIFRSQPGHSHKNWILILQRDFNEGINVLGCTFVWVSMLEP